MSPKDIGVVCIWCDMIRCFDIETIIITSKPLKTAFQDGWWGFANCINHCKGKKLLFVIVSPTVIEGQT